jgi:DNA polymerase-3 subunit alpha
VERLPSLLDRAQEESRRKEVGQFALFGGPAEAAKRPRPADEDGTPSGVPPLWSRRERLANEKEALGFYITGHPLESYEEEIRLFSSATTATLSSLRGGTEVKLGGLVASMKEKITKRGERMATVTFEDLEGIVEVVVFAEPLRKYRDLLESQEPVFLLGKYETDERGGRFAEDEAVRTGKILVEEVIRMENVRERLARSVKYRLLLDRLSPHDVADLRKILSRHPGDRKGYLHLVRDGAFEAVYSLDDRHSVSPSLDLARELGARFGYDVLSLHQ